MRVLPKKLTTIVSAILLSTALTGISTMTYAENTNPNDLIPALRPLMPQFAHLAAIQGTNALIVSDRAANIYQLETIIRNLDGTGQNDIEAVPLQSSQAEEIIKQLEVDIGLRINIKNLPYKPTLSYTMKNNS